MRNVVLWDTAPGKFARIQVSEERVASIFRMKIIRELGTLTATSSN
jgi:hypothetical protein